MDWVDECPQNLAEVQEASKKLGCGNDRYGNNQYLCLPNVEKTSLVEFCYNRTMGLFEKGNCLQAFQGNLTLSSCLQFSSGCPEDNFRSTEFYNYTACQKLNLEHKCYTFDPSCPPQEVNENTNIHLILGLIFGLLGIVLFLALLYFLCKKLRQRKEYKEQERQRDRKLLPPDKIDYLAKPKKELNFDVLCNTDNLQGRCLPDKTKTIVRALKEFGDYSDIKVRDLLKSIFDISEKYKEHWEVVGDVLAEENFAETGIAILVVLHEKCLKEENFTSSQVWYCYKILWTYSDESPKLAETIAKNEGVKYFTENCSKYAQNLDSKNVLFAVKASMSILHNISRTTDTIDCFKEIKTTEVLTKFVEMEDLIDETLTVISTLTLAHIVDCEQDKLIDKIDVINYCIDYIRKAIEPTNEERVYKGFTAKEVMEGLCKLAINDKCMRKMVEAGALSVFLDMLKGNHAGEQAITERVIWCLSFDNDNRKLIKEFPGMMEILDDLKKKREILELDPKKKRESEAIAGYANGALFVLNEENDVSKRPTLQKNRIKRDVYISYNWNEEKIIIELKGLLEKMGLKVFNTLKTIVDQSSLSALMKTLDEAPFVLICMSQKYKQSPKCRLEAEYTFQRGLTYFPLVVQKDFRPDGWLSKIQKDVKQFDTGLEKESEILQKLEQFRQDIWTGSKAAVKGHEMGISTD